MYLVNFATNSNQQYIQKPFTDSRINIDYLEVGRRSAEIENLTARVIDVFFKDVYQGNKGFNVQTLWSEHQQYFQDVLEFTSGKCSFVTEYSEVEINQRFQKIEDEEQQRAVDNKTGDKISFSYNYKKIASGYQDMSYLELVENSQMALNNSFLQWNFETYFPASAIEYVQEPISEVQLRPNPAELLERGDKWNYPSYFHLLQYVGKPINGSAEYVNVTKNQYFSKNMMLLKSDLNNLGQIFSRLKEIPILEYSRISMEIYKILRTQYINNKLQNWSSFCFFAAGDDILVAAAVSEVPKVIEMLEEITFDINLLIKEFITDIRVTCATGVIDTVWNVSPKETLPLVNNQLNQSKRNKKQNIIAYNDVLYDAVEFKRDLIFADYILKEESNLQDSYFQFAKLADSIKYNSKDIILELFAEDLAIKSSTKIVLQLITVTMTPKRILNFLNIVLLMSNSREPEILTRTIFKKRMQPFLFKIAKQQNKEIDQVHMACERLVRTRLMDQYFDVLNNGSNLGLFHKNELYKQLNLKDYVKERLSLEFPQIKDVDILFWGMYIEEIAVHTELELMIELVTDYARISGKEKLENFINLYLKPQISSANRLIGSLDNLDVKVKIYDNLAISIFIIGTGRNSRKRYNHQYLFEYEDYAESIAQIDILCMHFKLDENLIKSRIFSVISKTGDINNFINVTKQELIENIYLLDLGYYKSDRMKMIDNFLEEYCLYTEIEQWNIITALTELEELCAQMVIKLR